MEHNYRDNRDNVLHYRDIGILSIAQPYMTFDFDDFCFLSFDFILDCSHWWYYRRLWNHTPLYYNIADSAVFVLTGAHILQIVGTSKEYSVTADGNRIAGINFCYMVSL